MPHPFRVPEIVITPLLAAAAERAEQEFTVVPLPLPPPFVPDPYPTRPLTAAEPQELVADVPDADEVFEEAAPGLVAALAVVVAAFGVVADVVAAAAPVK